MERSIALSRYYGANATSGLNGAGLSEASGDLKGLRAYVDLYRVFRYGEVFDLARAALQSGPLNTRNLALAIMRAKGLDTKDKVLAKAVAARLINILRKQLLSGTIVDAGKFRGVRIWALPDIPSPQ